MISILYDTFKKWSAKGSVYIISDPHFSDQESFEFRAKNNKIPDGIKTAADLDNFIISNINKVVHKNDCLIILGDVGNIECITKLKASYKVLLLGNHDRGADYYKRIVTDITDLKADLDNFIISNINKVAHKNDCLIILGDVGNIECITKLKVGYKVLLLGNHDRGADYYKRIVTDITDLKADLAKAAKLPKELLLSRCELDNHVIFDNKLFDEVYSGPLMISDKIILSHEPIIPCPDYLVNLCGHVHAKDHKFEVDKHLYYNFCAEVIDYKPVSLGELIKDGLLSKVKDIHRVTVDGAIIRKKHRAKR